jgi:orotidine-5'-phosphate decarboxylase
MPTRHFADRLGDAVHKAGNPLCVGIDPRWESLPQSICERHSDGTLEGVARAFEEFSIRILNLVAKDVGVVKPQSAFFEACGPAGMTAMQSVIRHAKDLGLFVILDSKRGDIASTATAYADAAFAGTTFGGTTQPVWNTDALTVNPYLGRDSIEPFLTSARKSSRGIFVLVRTSNAGSGLFQELIYGSKKLYHAVAEQVVAWNNEWLAASGFGDVGAVVGATHPAELAELRALMPGVWFLVPGYGAQGGTANDVAGAFFSNGLGAIVNSSRGITFPFHPADPDWEQAVVTAVKRSTNELAAIQNC